MATLSKDSKYYDISNGSRKYIKYITKRKAKKYKKTKENKKEILNAKIKY